MTKPIEVSARVNQTAGIQKQTSEEPVDAQKYRKGIDRVWHAAGYSLAGLRAGRAGYQAPQHKPDKRARRLIRALGDIDAI